MKRTIGALSLILAVPVMLALFYAGTAAAAPQAGGMDGKAIFLAQKCNLCHSVPPAGIEKTTKSEKMAGPDLVNVKHDAAWITKYLKKEEMSNGKKHPKEVKLADGELKALVDWIAGQKK